MTTGLQLNSAAYILNNQGIWFNRDLVVQYYEYFNHPTTALLSTICEAAKKNARTNGPAPSGKEGGFNSIYSPGSGSPSQDELLVALDGIGKGVTKNNYLIDTWTAGKGAVSDAGIYVLASSTASVSGCLLNQMQAPFILRLGQFGNIFMTAYGFCSQNYDAVASTTILKTITSTTYAESGVGYASQLDLATGGIARTGPLLSSVVRGWGTMYDITNMNAISDPYVFGQNLLDQGLGQFGDWDLMLANVGLDITNLPQIPPTRTITTVDTSTTGQSTPIGPISYPTMVSTTITTDVPGRSPDVVKNIYSKITHYHLDDIVSATNYTTMKVNSCVTVLSDFLEFKKVVTPDNLAQLADIGITDFTTFSSFLQARVGQGSFPNWGDLADFLLKLDIPSQDYTPTPKTQWPPKPNSFSATKVVTQQAETIINDKYVKGSGELNTPVIWDFLGAAAGMPYTDVMRRLNANMGSDGGVMSALQNLKTAVDAAIAQAVWDPDTNKNDYSGSSGGSGGGDEGGGGGSGGGADVIGAVVTAVTALNKAVMSAATNDLAQHEWNVIQDRLIFEHNNLIKAGAAFTAAPQTVHNSFSQNWVYSSIDKSKFHTYQFFSNLFTADKAGDTLRATRSEIINNALFSSKGIEQTNDPDPQALSQTAKDKGTDVVTVVKQNK